MEGFPSRITVAPSALPGQVQPQLESPENDRFALFWCKGKKPAEAVQPALRHLTGECLCSGNLCILTASTAGGLTSPSPPLPLAHCLLSLMLS